MTAAEPVPAVSPRAAVRFAVACAEPHPILIYVLCKRLTGHLGLHASDGGDAWTATAEREVSR